MKLNKIYQGDALKVLKTLPDECVDCVITSPPYYGLRDYGTAKWEGGDEKCDHVERLGRNDTTPERLAERAKLYGSGTGNGSKVNAIQFMDICLKCGAKRIDQQLGLEKTLDEYLTKMLLITNELKRVLKKTGTLFWNHGDCYSASRWTGNQKGQPMNKFSDGYRDINPQKGVGLDDKTLVLQNYRLVVDMVYKQGWYLRNQIIWHKPNCMPSSVKDRFTVDWEPVFFFVKNKKYWFETQYEDMYKDILVRANSKNNYNKNDELASHGSYSIRKEKKDAWFKKVREGKIKGRNKRCVWKISTQPFKDAHFATFPQKLIEPMVKAGCPEFICKKCGKAREKIFKRLGETTTEKAKRLGQENKRGSGGKKVTQNLDYSGGHGNNVRELKFVSYTDCHCNAGWNKGIILDCFLGSGTTAFVARKLGRNFIGIELSKTYCKMAGKRLAQQVLF